MTLKIANHKGTFDLPSSFSIEIEETSPVYNERGSQSATATLPCSPVNCKLTNHIYRIDNNQAPTQDDRVVISDSIYQRFGKMNVTAVSQKSGIMANIGFNESEAYSIWNAVSLQSLKLPVIKPANGLPGVISYLNDILNNRIADSPLQIFPVCLSVQKLEENSAELFYEHINAYSSQNGQHTLISEARTETFIINNEKVETSLPEGYGIAPFLTVWYVIESIFKTYGYTVIENPFRTHYQLARLVLLHNYADTCIRGYINYSELMPECTINEFLQALYCRFGLVYFIDGKTRNVRLRLLRDILTTPASQDWTDLKISDPTINYNTPSQLKLSASSNINGPTPCFKATTTSETLDDFLRPYGYRVSHNKATTDSVFYYRIYGLFAKLDPENSKFLIELSSDLFPWDRKSDISYHEINSNDESVPVSMYASTTVLVVAPAYLFGKVHRYTSISSANVELAEKKDIQTPLAFCFSVSDENGFPFGTPRNFSILNSLALIDGKECLFSLTFTGEYGLFQHFWKTYDAILRHANHTIEVDMRFTSKQINDLDLSLPVSFGGQRLLIDSIRYKLPMTSYTIATVRFRTLQLLQPFDLDKEQNVPIIDI